MNILRTNSENIDFINLVQLLDSDLAVRDGNDHSFYNQFNKIDNIRHAIVVYENETPLGCGAIKQFDSSSMEIKRMYTTSQSRGKGVATMILSELEKWATELSFEKCILETGIRQPEAIELYKKNGYVLTSNYGQYKDVADSKCFAKYMK